MRKFIGILYVFAAVIILSACGAGSSSDDGGGSSTPGITAPSAGVTILAGNGEITISWTPVTEATSYNIYWSNSPGVTKLLGTRIEGVTSPYIHSGLTNGLTYYYVGTAVNSAGESIESSEVSATPFTPPSAPTAPTGVMGSAGNEQATISWSPVTEAVSYNIYWATSTGVSKGSGTKIEGVTSPYTQTALINGTEYFCIVTAVNAVGESIESSETSVTPLLAPPPPPPL